MPQINYFVTFLYFDTKHQRSNKLSHLSIAILQGEKTSDHQVEKMELLSSYGYYSHRIPSSGDKTFLEKTLEFCARVSFRIRGSYAEFKKEELINIDLGFGIEGGPIIEITEEEKLRLEAKIQSILDNEANFFGPSDLKAKEIVEQLGITDSHAKEKKLADLTNQFREEHYKEELEAHNDDEGMDLIIENTARESGLISERRLQQEKLKIAKNIELFEFEFSPQGRTCKTMGIELVMNCLSEDQSGITRKMILSDLLMDGFYTSAMPRFTKGISKFIFNSEQHQYSSTSGRPPIPKRNWDDEGIHCSLVFFEANKYIDLNGSEHELKEIEHKHKYVLLVENLMHLKRLLNDFCTQANENQIFIRLIDQAIHSLNACADDIQQVMNVYHGIIKNLKEIGCFNSISKDILKTEKEFDSIKDLNAYIKQHHIKLEDGLMAEIKRLNMIRKHVSYSAIYKEVFDQPRISINWAFFSRKHVTTEMDDPMAIELDEIKVNPKV